ncbi:MAG: transposase [Oscillospiraceae bacterium]|nr:transposase [Oscillospiraceae bacterium]
MGKPKYEAEVKLKIVEDCLNGRDNPSHVWTTQGIRESVVRRWIARYKAEGPMAFLTPEKNRRYSSELKKQVVEEYISGKSSILELMSKYAIRSESRIREWIKIYNNRGDFKEIVEGGSYTVRSRSTTQEERLAIVRDCIENGLSYSEAASKYQVSYQQVRTWVLRFKELGEPGLEDRRGQRKKDQVPRTREEELEQKIAQLEHEKYLLEMENWLLKKVKELEGRDGSHR